MPILTLDTTSLSAVRTTFLVALLVQLNLPWHPTYWDYFYPTDYLTNNACKFSMFGICLSSIPSACSGGPNNTLPKFDYIVVGAGPTGLTIANRLASIRSDRLVLVIEDGDAPPVDVVTPTWFPFLMNIKSAYNYTAEKNFLNIVDGPGNTGSRSEINSPMYGLGYTNGLPCDAGRALGGGTVMNAMLWVCGTSQDYEGWKNTTGVSGWGWGTCSNTIRDGMCSYYKKAMKMSDPTLPSTCANFAGSTGPLTITNANSDSSVIPLLKSAAQSLNYPLLADINCGKWIGMANIHVSVKNSERNHAARAYLSPLYGRRNLLVMRNSQVTKVLLSGNLGGTITAQGVSVITRNVKCPSFNLFASREIIISAGAYNSPKILLQSGIGRSIDLSGNNNGIPWSIPQKIDRPVGLNLHDHPFSLHFVLLNVTSADILAAQNPINNLVSAANQYFDSRTGAFSYMGSLSSGLFLNVYDTPVNPNSFPNIEWLNYQFDYKQSEFSTILMQKFRIKPEFAQQLLAANQNYKILMVYNTLLNPKSRGAVSLRDGNPLSTPKIYGNYLTDVDGSDRKTMIEGIKVLSKFIDTPAMKTANAKLFKFNIAECDTLTYQSDAYWSCYFKYFLQNEWHPAGTCKMSKTTDPSAVVDPTLKVLGMSGVPRVRVADASIMSQIPSGNTQCPCYAIGEKAADMIIMDNP